MLFGYFFRKWTIVKQANYELRSSSIDWSRRSACLNYFHTYTLVVLLQSNMAWFPRASTKIVQLPYRKT